MDHQRQANDAARAARQGLVERRQRNGGARADECAKALASFDPTFAMHAIERATNGGTAEARDASQFVIGEKLISDGRLGLHQVINQLLAQRLR